MAEQKLLSIYRTGEYGGTFRNAYTITFFGDIATIQGLSGKFSWSDRMELAAYFILNGIKFYEYSRHKPCGRAHHVKRAVNG